MTVELWIGREYEHAHEMKALRRFYSQMVEIHGQEEDFYFLFANFFCQTEEIDLAVVKRNGIAVIELKEVEGAVVGRENGPWTVEKQDGTLRSINDRRTRNPFQQLRAYRYAMINQLKKDSLGFLPRRKAELMRLDHVSAMLTFCPKLNQDSDLQFDPPKWFGIVGLDELPQELHQLRSSSLDFRYSEIEKLAKIWGLFQPAPGLFLTIPGAWSPDHPTVGTAMQHANPDSDTFRGDSTPVKSSGQRDTQSSAASSLLEKSGTCVICRYTTESCDLPYLHGTLHAVSADDQEPSAGRALHIATDEGASVVLRVRNRHLSQVLPSLERAVSREQTAPRTRGITVAAFHLTRQTEQEYIVESNGLVVFEPEWLIDVTDLTKIEYCARQYLIDRLRLGRVNHHIVRGNIVHRAFEQMIRTPHDDVAITQALKSAFHEQVTDLAMLSQTKQSTWQEVRSHYGLLKQWAVDENLPGSVQSEVFLISPELGMKGKIDAVWWSGDGYLSHIGELKTSKSHGPEPRPGHALQAGAYSLMTHLRDWGNSSNQVVWLLYSGNSRLPNSINVKRQVQITADTVQEIVRQRNLLVLADYLMDAPFETDNLNKCRNCTIIGECKATALILDHSDPRPQEIQNLSNALDGLNHSEKTWFQAYTKLLAEEYRAVKESHAALWQKSPEERLYEGTSVLVAGIHCDPSSDFGGRYVYDFLSDFPSELREDDVVLVSDSRGPAAGLIAQGIVRSPLKNGLSVEFQQPLGFEPRYIDRYVTENLVKRQFAGPYSWLYRPKEYRDLIIQQRRPRFDAVRLELSLSTNVGPNSLNYRQKLAVQMALEMQDYMLIQGPPGSGKTMLIVSLVREFINRGKRVLLAAGTNTAVDNMLRPLKDVGLGDHLLRLGSERRTDHAVREFLPETLAQNDDLDTNIQQLRLILMTRPIVAATATTWLSGSWDLLPEFDVAIVDEAAQLTVPATLGPLRLSSKFILIGDHMQLPAVVLSESQSPRYYVDENPAPRLSTSLFELLYEDLDRPSAKGLVKLNEQYRMNEEICAIPRRMEWYDELRPATREIASAKLMLRTAIQTGHPLKKVLDPEQSVVFVDVPWTLYGGSARTNEKEAQLVREFIRTYLDHGLSITRVGVIAPFRAQVALIRRFLEASLPENISSAIRSSVDTVDRFQGQQRDLIILSLATHTEHVHDLLFDKRRLNVALTRAKHKLIILGDTTVLKKEPIYLRLIEQCTPVRLTF